MNQDIRRHILSRLLMVGLLPAILALMFTAVLVIGGAEWSVNPDQARTYNSPVVGRLAGNIALKSGAVRRLTDDEIELIETYVEQNPDIDSSLSGLFVSTGIGCYSDSLPNAIEAVESYLRPLWFRNMEEQVGQTIYQIFGRYPDWSYGRLQVKPSTAQSILESTNRTRSELGLGELSVPPHNELAEYIIQRCYAAQLTRLAITLRPNDTVKSHALRHVGGEGVPTIPGVVEYSSVVSSVQGILFDAERNSELLTNASSGFVPDSPNYFTSYATPSERPEVRFDNLLLRGSLPKGCFTFGHNGYLTASGFGPLDRTEGVGYLVVDPLNRVHSDSDDVSIDVASSNMSHLVGVASRLRVSLAQIEILHTDVDENILEFLQTSEQCDFLIY